jgi:hypothetical protein
MRNWLCEVFLFICTCNYFYMPYNLTSGIRFYFPFDGKCAADFIALKNLSLKNQSPLSNLNYELWVQWQER